MTAGLTSALSFSPPGAKKFFSNVDTGIHMRASAARTNLLDLGTAAGGTALRVTTDSRILPAVGGVFPQYSGNGYTGNGMRVAADRIDFWVSGGSQVAYQSGLFDLSTTSLGFGSTIRVLLDASGILALKNSTTQQTLRIYGTTTGSKYLQLTHDGTDGTITTTAGKLILLGNDGVQLGSSGASNIGFYGVTPGARPGTGVSPASFVENAGGTAVNTDSTFGGYTIQQLAQALQNLGLID